MAVSRGAKTAKAVRKPTVTPKKPAQRTHNASRATSASTSARTTARVTPLDDYEGVRQVLSRYCFALDSGQLEALSPLFHHDASFSVSFESGQTHTGRAMIQAWYGKFFSQQPGQFRFLRHKIYEPQLTVTGNQATSVVYFDADSLQADGSVHVVAGRYDDTLVKEQGQWFFKDRIITVFYNYTPGTGQEGMLQEGM
jgi:ketosteroid isomerase-like protein